MKATVQWSVSALHAKALGLVRMRDLLDSPRWWSTRELAERLEIGERTAQRWLNEMEYIGCPIEVSTADGGGARLRYRRYRG